MILFFWGLCGVWALLELWLLVGRTVLAHRPIGKDRTLPLFLPLLFAALLLPIILVWLAGGASPAFDRVPGKPGLDSLSSLALLLCGIAIRIAAVLSLGRDFSLTVAGDGEQRLRTTGLYAWIRHPSYLGSILCYTGFALFIHPLAAPFTFALVLIAHLIRIIHEERYLESKFGPAFMAYRCRTCRLLPFLY